MNDNERDILAEHVLLKMGVKTKVSIWLLKRPAPVEAQPTTFCTCCRRVLVGRRRPLCRRCGGR